MLFDDAFILMRFNKIARADFPRQICHLQTNARLGLSQDFVTPTFVKNNTTTWPWWRGLGSGIVSACGVVGRVIESRRGIGWQFKKQRPGGLA
jgi:hypothetical protein